MDDLANIKPSCHRIISLSKHVKIQQSALEHELESRLDMYKKRYIEWLAPYHFADGTELTAQYVLVLDALNFCFWQCDGYEYEHLAGGLKRVVEQNPEAFLAENLAMVSDETLQKWIGRSQDEIVPLLSERSRAVRQVGTALLTYFEGKTSNLLKRSNGSARALVSLVLQYFPMFRDTAIYRGHQCFFYKRAQIFVGDIFGAYKGVGLGEFSDIDQITCFADYRVPQLLRELGILEYDKELAAKVDSKSELNAGGEEELEIRAATIIAVEKMVEHLHKLGVKMNAYYMDWILWNRGEEIKSEIRPHPRVLTIFY